MLRSLFHRKLRGFATHYSYDARYMQELLEADLSGFLKFNGFLRFSGHRFGLPPGPYFAAKFAAVRLADCGPCAQLVLDMAEEAGVRQADIAAAWAGAGDADMRLAIRLARAVVDNSADLAQAGAEVEARFGKRGRIGLASAIAAVQVFPMMKRGMGHAKDCALLPAAFRSAPA